MQLKPLHPHEAKKRYLEEKKTHVTSKSLYNYTTTLDQFTEWLTYQGVNDMRDVESATIAEYKEFRLGAVKPITARNDIRTIRGFIRECESYQCVPQGLNELIRVPKVSEEDKINDTILTREEAEAILDHLNKYNYASTRHTIMLILWKTGMRLSGLRTLDVGDVDFSRPALEVRHRPETGTPLKRKSKSERDVNITESMATSIRVTSRTIEHPSPTDMAENHW